MTVEHATSARIQRGHDFLKKAERLLRWLDIWLTEIRQHGEQSDGESVQRTMFSAIAGLGATQEALLSAASCWGAHAISAAITDARKTNEHVRFYYHARNVELHNSVTKWDPKNHHVTTAWHVTDQGKHERVFWMYNHPLFPMLYDFAVMRFIFGAATNRQLDQIRFNNGRPIDARVQAAGVEVWYSMRGLILIDFEYSIGKGQKLRIPAPANDAADLSLQFAVDIHRDLTEKLRTLAPI